MTFLFHGLIQVHNDLACLVLAVESALSILALLFITGRRWLSRLLELTWEEKFLGCLKHGISDGSQLTGITHASTLILLLVRLGDGLFD